MPVRMSKAGAMHVIVAYEGETGRSRTGGQGLAGGEAKNMPGDWPPQGARNPRSERAKFRKE